MACDLAVCSTESTFSLPEPRRGLTAAGGGLLMRIMQMVPQKAAMELMLTCEPFSAQKALDCFLVNRVVEPDRVLDEAISLAKLICKGERLLDTCTTAFANSFFQGVIAHENIELFCQGSDVTDRR